MDDGLTHNEKKTRFHKLKNRKVKICMFLRTFSRNGEFVL